MIRIGDFEIGSFVRLTDVDGNVFEGHITEVTHADDRSDLERQEHGITVKVDGKHIGFYLSEIDSVEIVKPALQPSKATA